MIETHSPIGNVIVAQTVQVKARGFSALTFLVHPTSVAFAFAFEGKTRLKSRVPYRSGVGGGAAFVA